MKKQNNEIARKIKVDRSVLERQNGVLISELMSLCDVTLGAKCQTVI